MNKKVDDSICPFCHKSNNCMAHSEEPCWCRDVVIPQSLLDLLPEKHKGNTCICLLCINAYNDNPTKFKKEVAN